MGSLVGYRVCITRVGPVGNLCSVTETIPVVVGVEVVLYAVAVEVFHHVRHVDGDGLGGVGFAVGYGDG